MFDMFESAICQTKDELINNSKMKEFPVVIEFFRKNPRPSRSFFRMFSDIEDIEENFFSGSPADLFDKYHVLLFTEYEHFLYLMCLYDGDIVTKFKPRDAVAPWLESPDMS